MFEVKVPGFGDLKINFVVFDLNGTLTTDGQVSDEVAFLAGMLKEMYGFKYFIVTAATRGIPEDVARKIGAEIRVVEGNENEEKKRFVEELGREYVCAIGNGANDISMLDAAALGICVIGSEGASPQALLHSDIVVKSIEDALKLFLHPKRLVATLRY